MKRKIPFAVGKIYHIYNRGVAKCQICDGEADCWRFMQGLCLFNDAKSTSSILWHLERDRSRLTMNVLKQYLVGRGKTRESLVRIMAYCVMGNHYHLLVEEIQEGGITKFMHKFGVGYVNYFNNKHKRVGSLFQGRFKNVLVETDQQLLYLLVYINVLNPAEFVAPNWKEQGIPNIRKVLQYAKNYIWSTHLEYLGERNSLIIDKGILGKMLSTSESYRELVYSVLRGKKYEAISELTFE